MHKEDNEIGTPQLSLESKVSANFYASKNSLILKPNSLILKPLLTFKFLVLESFFPLVLMVLLVYCLRCVHGSCLPSALAIGTI